MALPQASRFFVDPVHPSSWSATNNSTSAQTNTALRAAPGAGLRLVLTDIIISTDATETLKVIEATTDIVEVFYLGANGNVTHNFTSGIRLSENVNLNYTTTTSANTSITVSGFTEEI